LIPEALAADLMMEKGALSVRAICTYAILSGDAYEKIEKSQLLELIVTDSIPLKKESKKNKSVELCPTLQMLCTWYIIIIPLAEIYHVKQFLFLEANYKTINKYY
jgi:hypothetical protein